MGDVVDWFAVSDRVFGSDGLDCPLPGPHRAWAVYRQPSNGGAPGTSRQARAKDTEGPTGDRGQPMGLRGQLGSDDKSATGLSRGAARNLGRHSGRWMRTGGGASMCSTGGSRVAMAVVFGRGADGRTW